MISATLSTKGKIKIGLLSASSGHATTGRTRVQRKSFLQLAIRASWSYHLLAQTSFQLAPKAFWWAELISQFFCCSNSSKNITCPSGKLKTEFTSLIAKSTSPRLSDTTFFARWVLVGHLCNSSSYIVLRKVKLPFTTLEGRVNFCKDFWDC